MRAELRDAQRALRRMSMTPPAVKVAKPKALAKCYICGVEMVNAGGRATGGICGVCMGKARAQKQMLKVQHAAYERSKRPRPAKPEWKPRRRKHEPGYGTHHG